uniref:Uncharacterized protein n=1 Tax=viral metagenome TaxID=1070528 RepID=A0A6M3J445_9ZZZZ
MPDVDILGEGPSGTWTWTPSGKIDVPGAYGPGQGAQFGTQPMGPPLDWVTPSGKTVGQAGVPVDWATPKGFVSSPDMESLIFGQRQPTGAKTAIVSPPTPEPFYGPPYAPYGPYPGEFEPMMPSLGDEALQTQGVDIPRYDASKGNFVIFDQKVGKLRDAQYWEIDKEIRERAAMGGAKNFGGYWIYFKEGYNPIISRSGPDSALFDVSRWVEPKSDRVMALEERDWAESLISGAKSWQDYLTAKGAEPLSEDDQDRLAQLLAGLSNYQTYQRDPLAIFADLKDIQARVKEAQDKATSTTFDENSAPKTSAEAKSLLSGYPLPEVAFREGSTREMTQEEVDIYNQNMQLYAQTKGAPTKEFNWEIPEEELTRPQTAQRSRYRITPTYQW